MFLACSIYAQTPAQLSAVNAAQQKQINTLIAQVAALQRSPVQQLAPYVAVDYNTENGVVGPNITFHGVNVHIVNGAGQTTNINGLGNLIIGYDESPGQLVAGDRGGSHNLVLGQQNKFQAWASSGIINGLGNTINGQNTVILSGDRNTVTGNSPGLVSYGVIIDGENNTLFDATSSCIVDGVFNNIGRYFDVIIGGGYNQNGGIESVILGGFNTNFQPGVGGSGILPLNQIQ
jgi:hypothetical protein